jgi:hypothetical protein
LSISSAILRFSLHKRLSIAQRTDAHAHTTLSSLLMGAPVQFAVLVQNPLHKLLHCHPSGLVVAVPDVEISLRLEGLWEGTWALSRADQEEPRFLRPRCIACQRRIDALLASSCLRCCQWPGGMSGSGEDHARVILVLDVICTVALQQQAHMTALQCKALRVDAFRLAM